jgi:hypothetical protein
MRPKKLSYLFLAAGLVLLITVGIFLFFPAQPVSAQCGSQASSCKNCHETQAQDPVNADGTTWHTQHAFGDFCYLCHGGNNQATDKTAAHTGMVNPLVDIVSSCKACHATDYQSKAQVYATTLGVTLGSGAGTSTPAAASTTPVATGAPIATLAPVAAALAANIPAGSLVDYSQRYDETVLGQQPVNVGNVILIVIIAALLLGGGFFVLRRENWIKVSFQETRQIEDGYPADVVDMLPELAKLRESARADLRKIIARPGTAGEVFALVTKLTGKGKEPTPPEDEKPEA